MADTPRKRGRPTGRRYTHLVQCGFSDEQAEWLKIAAIKAGMARLPGIIRACVDEAMARDANQSKPAE
jgi:hypothetical protein